MSENSGGGKVIIFIVILVIVVGGAVGGWYFFVYQPEQKAIEKARLEEIAKAEAEQRAKEQAAQNKIKYDQLIQEADTAFANENWESASRLYSEASALFPDEQYPKDQLSLVNAKLEEMARRASGYIEMVSSPTGRYYVIISSSLDDDLAMDHAKKLAEAGNKVKIVEHQMDKHTYTGVSLGDYSSFEQAASAIAEFESYGDGVWVLKQ